MKYLVVFEEAGGPEFILCATQTKAVEAIQQIQHDCKETDDDMVASVKIYGVVSEFKYQPPVGSAGLVEIK